MPSWIVTGLDDYFLALLDRLSVVAAANSIAVCNSDYQRQWFLSAALGAGWSGNPMDIQGMNLAFDRSALNSIYLSVLSSTSPLGRTGEAGLLKIQIDYVAAVERSFRTSQASSIRCKIHAAARRSIQGASGGLFDIGGGTIVIWLNNLLAGAHADPDA
jgi:hypothetical protein